MFPSFTPLGDRAIRITFGDQLTEATNDFVTRAYRQISSAKLPYITEMVIGYVTLTVNYRTDNAPCYETIIHQLEQIVKQLKVTSGENGQKA